MELAGNGNAATLAAFLSQMWEPLSEPLGVIGRIRQPVEATRCRPA
jgi:hypothetical protein